MTDYQLITKYFTLSDSQQLRFESLRGVYEHWNSQINVISRKDIDNFYERHALHSLAIAKVVEFSEGEKILDLGCGGGFPVVPLSILFDKNSFTAVDSIGKKITVVNAVKDELKLDNVEAFNCRVETIEGEFEWVVSRAVAPLKELMKWTKGKWTKGMLLLKGGELGQEIREAGFGKGKDGVYRNKAGNTIEIVDISSLFEGEFFETKKVVFVKK